jgi:hypothetical protein
VPNGVGGGDAFLLPRGDGDHSPVRHTAAVTTQPMAADAVIAQLLVDPTGARDVRTLAPMTSGLYVWWASPDVLPALVGRPNPWTPTLRLLYVGIATKLRSRLASNHLGRRGSSTLRRTLAGFLLDDEQVHASIAVVRLGLHPDSFPQISARMASVGFRRDKALVRPGCHAISHPPAGRLDHDRDLCGIPSTWHRPTARRSRAQPSTPWPPALV